MVCIPCCSRSSVRCSSLRLSAQTAGIREVTATDRNVIPLNTRLRYTTMIVLPEGDEILDVICGDRDFWVVSAVQNVAHVKPAKADAETNLNLVTARGTIYSFLLKEKTGCGTAGSEDLRQCQPDSPRMAGRSTTAPLTSRTAEHRADRGSERDRSGRSSEPRRRSRRPRSSIREAAVRLRHAESTSVRSSCVPSGTTESSPT